MGAAPAKPKSRERVWVTGASGGLGEEVAAAYAARGCAVVLSARRRRELDRVAARCREAGAPTAEVVPLDQGDAASIERALRGALAAPLDVVVCNALPALAALAATGRLLDSVTLVWAYKAYVEAAGHAGCESRATSFPQCVWLPRYLGIALRTADHDAHHGAAAVNFAKRFTLWDRVFGTYATPSPNPPLRAPSFEKAFGG